MSNQVMIGVAGFVIAGQTVYAVGLLASYLKYLPMVNCQGQRVHVTYPIPRNIWLSQVWLALSSIYQSVFCILASMATSPIPCNVFWQNCMIGFCSTLYAQYTFLLLKNQAVEYGRTKGVKLLHRALMLAVAGLLPFAFILSFFGIEGKMLPITDHDGNILSAQDICVLQYQPWTLIIVPAMDMGVNVSCVYLFIQPLLSLKRQAEAQEYQDNHKNRAKDYQRIIYENVVAGFISVLLTSWVSISIFVGFVVFRTNLGHLDCVIAILTGLVNSILAGYTTRRGLKFKEIDGPTKLLTLSTRTSTKPESAKSAKATSPHSADSGQFTSVVV